MLDAIDKAPAGSVYVMVLPDGADFAGIGGLMATAMKVRACRRVVDASIRDTPQIKRLQFRCSAGGSRRRRRSIITVRRRECAGDVRRVRVNPNDIIVATRTGGAVPARSRRGAQEAQESTIRAHDDAVSRSSNLFSRRSRSSADLAFDSILIQCADYGSKCLWDREMNRRDFLHWFRAVAALAKSQSLSWRRPRSTMFTQALTHARRGVETVTSTDQLAQVLTRANRKGKSISIAVGGTPWAANNSALIRCW